MRRFLSVGGMVVVVFLALANRQLAAQSPADADTQLAKLSWLVGGKWLADVKSQDGSPLTVEVTFDWARHKKAIRYSILFKHNAVETPQYEGMYWWHPGKKQLAMLQINRQGDVSESTVEIDGQNFRQANTVTRSDGTTQQQRVEFARDGNDAFTFRALVPKGSEWVEAVSFRYTRSPDAQGR